jgi:hypothetical protein
LDRVRRWGSVFTKPQPGLGPGVGAQVASLQSPVFRSGRLKCIRSSGFKQWTERKNSLILAALSDMVDNGPVTCITAPGARPERPARS